MTLDDAQVDRELLLAEKWWVPCQHTDKMCDCHADCSLCHGTDKLYPLRKPCPAMTGGRHIDPFAGDDYECATCDARGYIPNVTLETMLEAAQSRSSRLKLVLKVAYYPTVDKPWVVDLEEDHRGVWGDELISTFVDAMLQIAERRMK